MAAAVQHAPAEKQKAPQSARKTQTEPKKTISQTVGIAVMIVLLVVSLFVGNFRALQKATPAAFLRQGDVKSIVEDRVSSARNAVTVASRTDISKELTQAVETAGTELAGAKTARKISRANQSLSAAVSEMIDAAQRGLDAEGQSMLTRALDTFTEEGNFLRQEARTYNEKAQKALSMYEKLPTKFVLPRPDFFEGL